MKLFATERTTFPDPKFPLADGIVDVNDDVRVERLLEAYSFGIFPWPHEDYPVLWHCPDRRGILEFKDFHISRSLQKLLDKNHFQVTFDKAFDQVIEECAAMARPGQAGTWINSKLIKAYKAFHRAGYAHSLEVWQSGELVGGLYGVMVGGVFGGESMFFKVPNASKVAVVKLVEFLRAQGLEWMDIQMVTPVLKQFGGKYVSRSAFLKRLENAKKTARFIEFSK